MRCPRRLALAGALASLLACARAPAPGGPVPLLVSPAQGTELAAVAVEIAGRDFDAWTRADLAASSGTLDATFTAELQPVAGGDAVPLGDVVLTSGRTLRATVPAGLARGLYRLRVTDPRGRSGVLEQAFQVVAPAEAVTAFRVDVLEPPQAGIAFPVALTAVDARGQVVEAFDGTVALARAAGALSPGSAGPFVRGRFLARPVIPELAAGERITASGPRGCSGTSEPFDVVAGVPIAVVFPGKPVSTAAGACSPRLEVELRDVLGHPSPAEAEVAMRLLSAPPGLGFFSDEACAVAATSVTVPAGSSRASFHFKAAAAGVVMLRALPAMLPSASQEAIVGP